MADEQTPELFDDPVDPVQPQVPSEPVQNAAGEVRSRRPVRKAAAKSQAPTPSTDTSVESQPAGTGSSAAPAARPAMPRPVRRTTPRAAEAEVVDEARAPRTTRRPSKEVAEAPSRTTPALFVRQSVDELRKVIWPTGNQLANYFAVVLLFVLFIIAYVGLLDLFFGWGLLKLLGK